MFIGFNDGSWLKALYNDESCAWELIDSDEVPNKDSPEGDSEFYYPYKQYLPNSMENCGKLEVHEIRGNTQLILSFSSSLKLVLSHNPKEESEHIEVNT